MLYNICSWNSY